MKPRWEHDRSTGRRVYCEGRMVYGHVEEHGTDWIGTALRGATKVCESMTEAQRFVERIVREQT